VSFLDLGGVAAGAVAVGASVLWLVSLARRDASLVDRFWGLGFVVVATLGALWGAGLPERRWLVAALVAVWGVRLSLHIHLRTRGHGEDPRYRAMRERAGGSFAARSLVTVFLLQAVLVLLIAAPLLAAASLGAGRPLGALDLLATLVWLAGFLFEAVADQQLRRFRERRRSPDEVLDRGLWRYSRHPNYFGEALLWWGFGLFGLAVASPATLGGPLLLTLLLLRVSGVTLLESQLRATKPGYAAYVARTNAFLPGPPKAAS